MSASSLKSVTYRQTNSHTPQTQKAAKGQKRNAAGGFSFVINDFERAKRFIILGAEDGFYTSGQQFAKENASAISRVIEAGRSNELVDYIVDVSTRGRAAKQQPGLFALAMASSLGTTEEKQYALSKLSQVARTGTTLFEFVGFALQFRSWGRALKRAVASWYENKNLDSLALQMVKYRSREGWTHGDILSVSHPKGGQDFNALAQWALGRETEEVALPSIVQAYEQAKRSETEADVLSVLDRFDGVTWEMIPNDKRTPEVWKALVRAGMPLGALLRQLPTLTRLEVLRPLTPELKLVVDRLTDAEALKKARIHPIQILVAMRVYESGGRHSRGKHTWGPSSEILAALDKAFYLSFEAVEPTGKRFLLGVDVSPSMRATISLDSPLTSAQGVGALSLVLSKTEPMTHTVAFAGGGRDGGVIPLDISHAQRLDDVLRIMNAEAGRWNSTDASLPIQYAIENQLEVDVFITLTDNDTWSGSRHPHEALAEYRRRFNPEAKLIVLATSPSRFSIADPNDAGSLDIAGFDSAVPGIIREFSLGY